VELKALGNQLKTYIIDMCSNNEFLEVKGIGGLGEKLVETKRNVIYPWVYLLVKLALIFISCNCYSRKSIFNNEHSKESIA
jgi:hypothetical protein